MIPFIFMNMMSLTICMIVLVAVVDVRHWMHSLHLQNIQVHKINTTSNSQGVIDPSRYFYFYYINDSNNPIEYSIYIIIKLLTNFFSINLYVYPIQAHRLLLLFFKRVNLLDNSMSQKACIF